MARKKLDRKTYGSGNPRVVAMRSLDKDAELALWLYAQELPKYRGRQPTASLANEHIIHGNNEFVALLPRARQLLEGNEALSAKEIYEQEVNKEAV